MKILIITFLILPFICSAGALKISPSAIDVNSETPLKLGMEWELPEIFIYNLLEQPSEFIVRIECFADSEELCLAEEYFEINPKTFYLNNNQGQEINVKIVLPRNANLEFGQYKTILSISPDLEGSIDGAKMEIAIGSVLNFSIEGLAEKQTEELTDKVEIENWKPFDYLLASMNKEIGIGFLIIILLLGVMYLSFIFFKKSK